MRTVSIPWKRLVIGGGLAALSLGALVRGDAAISNINTVSTLNGHPPVLSTSVNRTVLHGAKTVDRAAQQAFTALDARPTVASVLQAVAAREQQLCNILHCTVPPPQPPEAAPAYSVNVDGTPITAVTLASAAGSAELKSLQHGEPIDWTTAYERGVATSVLQQLLWEVVQQDGTAVSQAAAEAYAQQQLRMYLDNQSPDRPPIAAGETAEDVFTSAGAVAGYRRHLSVDAEMAAIAVRAYGSDYTPTQKDTAVFAWFASVLPSHLVRIEGMPSFDLATIVPSAA